jgi:hypothetical protein
MLTRFIPRLLMLSLMLAFALSTAIQFRASAAERIDWTETNSEENVLVQECGLYNITSSYTAEIAHHLIADNEGDEVSEQMNVDFVGSVGNPATGKSYQYDGHFTRWSNYIQSQVTITDLELRFEVGTPGQFTVAIDRIKMDLVADPTDVIKKFVPNALQMELCYLLPGSYDWNVAPAIPPSATDTETALSLAVSDLERTYSEPPETIPGYGPGCDVISQRGKPC